MSESPACTLNCFQNLSSASALRGPKSSLSYFLFCTSNQLVWISSPAEHSSAASPAGYLSLGRHLSGASLLETPLLGAQPEVLQAPALHLSLTCLSWHLAKPCPWQLVCVRTSRLGVVGCPSSCCSVAQSCPFLLPHARSCRQDPWLCFQTS